MKVQVMPQPQTEAAETFYSGAYARIVRFMAALGVLTTLVLGAVVGVRFAAGFAAGCVVAFVNFYWLKQAVEALTERLAGGGESSSSGVVARFVLRFGLMALVAYVIFKSSTVSVYGFLAGLFLPVAGICCEAAYEAYVALRRGI